MFKLSNIGSAVRKGYEKFEKWRKYSNSREQADRFRADVTERKGFSILNEKLIRQIKEYAYSQFGENDYWHWLALYTEIRGEFIEGWVPDDYYTFEWIPTMNPENVSGLSLIKSFDHRLFPGHTIQPVAVRINGQNFDHNQKRISNTEFYRLMKQLRSEVVIKKDCGPSGTGLFFRNSVELLENDFKDSYSYVIQPVVEQHDEMKKLSDRSVNTVRVVTFLKPCGKVQNFFTSLKFGVNGLRVDNVNMGGRFLLLDPDGVVTSNPFNELGLECRECIESGFEYRGFRVPSFRKAVELCKEQHLNFPYTRFIAWDVFIDKETDPRIIEWNARLPGMWVNEAVAGPLWTNGDSLTNQGSINNTSNVNNESPILSREGL